MGCDAAGADWRSGVFRDDAGRPLRAPAIISSVSDRIALSVEIKKWAEKIDRMQSMSRFFFLALLGCRALPAQSPNTLVSEAKFPWTVVRDNLLKMAEKMPEENYSF